MRIRNQYVLWMRLGVRAWEAATVVSLGRDRHGLLVAAALGCALYDVALATLLRRGVRLPLVLRGAADCVDIAAWSLVLGTGSVAPMAAAPLCLEIGLRYGWRGVGGPFAVGAGVVLLRMAAGRPAQLADVSLVWWTLVTAVVGAVARQYLRRKLDRQRRLAGAETEAAASQADLAGQNSVAAGADTVVDLLTRTAPLLAVDGASPRPSPLAAWKLALAQASADHASYLRVVLARWQRTWNRASPDLASYVHLTCAGESGLLLLSPHQVQALGQALDECDLRGRVTVAVPRPALPGRRQVLLVGDRELVVPPDPQPALRTMDVGPTAFVLATFLYLGHSLPALEAVPLWAACPSAAAAAGLAWWSHRHLAREGHAGYHEVIAAALLLGACDAVVSTLTMRNPYPDGLAGVPGAVFPAWFAPLLLIYARDLSGSARVIYGGLALAVVAASFALLPGPVPPWQVPVALIWPAASVMMSLGLRDFLDRDAADFRAELASARAAAVASAFRRGRRLVTELAAAAAEQTRRDYAAIRTRLDGDVAAEVDRRLQEADARLTALRAD
jgi:hypothetical protein